MNTSFFDDARRAAILTHRIAHLPESTCVSAFGYLCLIVVTDHAHSAKLQAAGRLQAPGQRMHQADEGCD